MQGALTPPRTRFAHEPATPGDLAAADQLVVLRAADLDGSELLPSGRRLCDFQMANQKLGLVADGMLEGLPEVDVEVAHRIALDLSPWGGRRVA
jgi:hypothetical protein